MVEARPPYGRVASSKGARASLTRAVSAADTTPPNSVAVGPGHSGGHPVSAPVSHVADHLGGPGRGHATSAVVGVRRGC
jgi:hypothetical protein